MKKLRKTNKQQAMTRRNNSNLINIEARINRKNEKSYHKAAKAEYKGGKKQRKVRKRQRAKAVSDSNAILNPHLSRLLKIAFGLFILFLLARTGYGIYDLKKQEQEALAERESLLLQERELEKQISIKDTPEYVEQQARNILHMIKPGEILYIPDPNANAKNRENTSESALTAKPLAGQPQQDENPPLDQTDEADHE